MSFSCAGANMFCFMRIKCNFVSMVGLSLTDDERCLIHNLRVKLQWGSERIVKAFFK